MAKINMSGILCRECKVGFYKETEYFDGIDELLHCSKCNHTVKLWEEMSEFEIVLIFCEAELKGIEGDTSTQFLSGWKSAMEHTKSYIESRM